MDFDEFHNKPLGDPYKEKMLLDLAKTVSPPVSLQRAKNRLKEFGRGAGEVTAKQILQAVAMCLAQKLPLEKRSDS